MELAADLYNVFKSAVVFGERSLGGWVADVRGWLVDESVYDTLEALTGVGVDVGTLGYLQGAFFIAPLEIC